MKKTETDKLLRKIAEGDNLAFERLYAVTKRGVFSFLYTYFHNYEETEDAMQTVYLKVKMGITSYRAGTNGSAWLLQIAKNHALNELARRREYTPLHEVEIPTQSSFCEGSVTETMQRVLSEEERRILTLHVLWRYKHKEIAEALNLPLGTVTSKYKRAIEKMKEALKEEKV